MAGGGYLAYSLISALSQLDQHNHYLQYATFGDFYYNPEWKKQTRPTQGRNFQRALAHNTYNEARAFWSSPPGDYEVQLGRPDIIQSNNYYCPTDLEWAKLVYVLYDLTFLQAPETTTETNRVGCFQGVFRASLYADHIVAISDYSKDHFLRIFPHFPSEQISVIPLGSRFSAPLSWDFPCPNGLQSLKTDQFWLHVGTIEPRKNQVRMLRAYRKLKDECGLNFPLVIVGGEGWHMKNFDQLIDTLHLRDDVIRLGYANDDQLQWLYRHCFAFVYPSLYEGFGLPILEAMSQGAAVIAGNTTSMPEVVGRAGLLVDPFKEDAIFFAMQQLLHGKSDRTALKTKALDRAKEFSWKKTANEFLLLYQRLDSIRS